MILKLIAAALTALLLAGPAAAQRQDGSGRGDRRLPLIGQGTERAPQADRRERLHRAEQRIQQRREGNGRAGAPRRRGGEEIYRRGNNYRRW